MAEHIGTAGHEHLEHEHRVSEVECLTHGFFRRVSWGAIFAGTVVAFVIEIILSLLGIGVGMGVVNPMSPNPAGLGIGAAIWLFITSLIALFCGGWVAGRLAGFPRYSGILHGIVTWGMVTLLSFYLMSSAFALVIGGVTNMVGRAANPATPAATQSAVSGRGREAAISSLMATGMNRQVAEKTVDTVIANLGGAPARPNTIAEQRQALQSTQKALGTISTTAIMLVIAMVIEAMVSALGGAMGAPKEEPLEHPAGV